MDGSTPSNSVDILSGLQAADSAGSNSVIDAITSKGTSAIQKTEKAEEGLAKQGQAANESILKMLEKMPQSIDVSKLPTVTTPKFDAPPTPPKPRDALENFGSWASVLGILGGAVLKAPISASLNASAAAMNAYNQGDWNQYTAHYQQWKDQTDLAFKQADFQAKSFDRALDVMKTDMAQGQWLVSTLAQQFGYTPAQQLALAQAPEQAAELQIKLLDSANSLRESATKIQVQHDLLDANKDLSEAQKSGDPTKITAAQQKHALALENFQDIFAPGLVAKPLTSAQMQSQAATLRIQATQYPVGSKERTDLEAQAKNIEDSLAQTKGGSAAAGKGMLSPQAVQMNAEIYLQTHEIPALGMGNQGDRTAILNRAAELAAAQGITVPDVLSGKAQYKADASSLTNLTKMSDSAEAYERTMLDNIKVLRGLMDKGAGTSAGPVVNRWIQAGRKATGDPDVAAFNAAITTVANEYARVQAGTTGSQARLTDSAREEAESMISKFDSPAAINEVIDATILPDTRNRISEYQTQISDIKKRIGSGKGGGAQADNYSSPDDVYRAVDNGTLKGEEAKKILIDRFGYKPKAL